MKVYDGSIEYNKALECYGLMGLDGKWVREELKDGDRIAIMIGNDVFHTDFREGFIKPSLRPLPWDNWDLLVGKPAAYYDFETPPVLKEDSKKTATKKRSGFFATVIVLLGLLGLFGTLSDFIENSYSAEEMDQAYEDGYDYALRDYIDCPYCGEGFPDRLAFETYDGDTICPDCIRGDFDALLTGEILCCYNCNELYLSSDSYGLGLCFDCAEHIVVECCNCNQPTSEWPGQSGFAVCADCMGELMEDSSVARAIDKWFEG